MATDGAAKGDTIRIRGSFTPEQFEDLAAGRVTEVWAQDFSAELMPKQTEQVQQVGWTIKVCPVHGHRLREGFNCIEVVGRDEEGIARFCHESQEVEVIPASRIEGLLDALERIRVQAVHGRSPRDIASDALAAFREAPDA